MKKTVTLFWLIGFLMLPSCASKNPKDESTADAQERIKNSWTPKIGTATKSEFVEEFGNPEWCKVESDGRETCRFYRKRGTKWMGEEGRDKKSVEKFDQVIADFDTNGVLRDFKNSAQR